MEKHSLTTGGGAPAPGNPGVAAPQVTGARRAPRRRQDGAAAGPAPADGATRAERQEADREARRQARERAKMAQSA